MKKIVALFLSLTLVLSMFAGCAAPAASGTPAAAAPAAPAAEPAAPAAEATAEAPAAAEGGVIKIGVPIPLSGGFATQGELSRAGIEAALEYFNQNGGLTNWPGYSIELVYGDTETDATVATNVFERLVNYDKVVACIGGYGSSLTAPMATLAIKYQVPFCIFPAVADSITAVDNDYVFRVNPGDHQEIDSIKEFFKTLDGIQDISSMALVVQNTDSGMSCVDIFKDIAADINAEIVLTETVQDGVSDLSGVVQKLKSSNASICVAFIAVNEALLFQRQLKEYNCTIPVFAKGNGYLDSSFLTNAGDTAENVLTSSHWLASSVNYLDEEAYSWYEWMNKYLGYEMNETSADAWMNMSVLLQAINNAKELTGPSISEAMKATDYGVDNWSNIFHGYTGVNYFNTQEGVYNQNMEGTDQFGQCINGVWELVWPYTLMGEENSKLNYPIK